MKTIEITKTMPKESQLEKLASLSKTLNNKTDAINAAILRLEKRLAEMNIGLEVWLGVALAEEGYFTRTNDRGEIIDPDGWSAMYSVELGYAKFNDEWHIVSRRTLDLYAPDDGYGLGEMIFNRRIESGPLRPLTSAPRAVRIEAMQYMDSLIAMIISTAEKHIKIIDEAAEKF